MKKTKSKKARCTEETDGLVVKSVQSVLRTEEDLAAKICERGRS